jgi:hypothetical protein
VIPVTELGECLLVGMFSGGRDVISIRVLRGKWASGVALFRTIGAMLATTVELTLIG